VLGAVCVAVAVFKLVIDPTPASLFFFFNTNSARCRLTSVFDMKMVIPMILTKQSRIFYYHAITWTGNCTLLLATFRL